METFEKKNYYTVTEVRKNVFGNNISTTTLHKLMNTGQIPFVNFSRKRLIPSYWVEAELRKAQGQ